MIGIVLGLGFQWWPELHSPWQYVAFIFVYIDIADYWIDYSLSLKKFPPKREIDVMLDLSLMFALFLYIYVTQLSFADFLLAFIAFKVLDYFWLLSSKHEYHPTGIDKVFVDTWIKFNLIEALLAAILVVVSYVFLVQPLFLLLIFIVFRICIRILASFQYKKIHFV